MKKSEIFKIFTSAIISGIFVSIGATANMSAETKTVGAFLFCLGLFAVSTLGYNLFTGKVCYCLDNDWKYVAALIPIWLGNLAGSLLSAFLLRMTRAAVIAEKAQELCGVKLGDSLLSVFILAFFCNIMIYIGVEEYRKNPHEVAKYFALVLAVMIFSLCGFEHCVANMFYISFAGAWSGRAVLFILVNTLGNAAGGMFIPAVRKYLLKV